MRSTVEENCVWALTSDAEERKHILANRESGDVSCFLGGFFFWIYYFFVFCYFSRLCYPQMESLQREEENNCHQLLHHKILDEAIFVVLICLSCMFPTRK